MTSTQLAKIACWLNAATIKIRKKEGSIRWLTGVETSVTMPGSASQETQCMAWGAYFMVANNADEDTVTQHKLIEKLKITSATQLLTFVEGTGQRVFFDDRGQSELRSAGQPKLKLLHELCGSPTNAPDPGSFVGNPGQAAPSLSEYTIGDDPLNPKSGITFVSGKYRDATCESFHAEQKLLATLAAIYRSGVKPHLVHVGGIKSPCSVCEEVLKAARDRLKVSPYSTILDFEEGAELKASRLNNDLGRKNASGIGVLRIDHYFPVPKQAEATGS